MRKKESKRVAQQQALLQELEQYRKNGCIICLNGRPCRPERIVAACLREDCSYMRDFVSDEKQQVKKIDFIKIKEKE